MKVKRIKRRICINKKHKRLMWWRQDDRQKGIRQHCGSNLTNRAHLLYYFVVFCDQSIFFYMFKHKHTSVFISHYWNKQWWSQLHSSSPTGISPDDTQHFRVIVQPVVLQADIVITAKVVLFEKWAEVYWAHNRLLIETWDKWNCTQYRLEVHCWESAML